MRTLLIAFLLGSLQLPFAPQPRISLGISSGTRGIEIEIPISYTPAREVDVSRLRLQVFYPREKLQFLRLSGYLAEREDVMLQSRNLPEEELPPDRAAGEEDPQGLAGVGILLESPEPLQAGILTTMVFKVAQELEPQVLAVGVRARMWNPAGEELSGVEAYEGRISIQEPKVFYGCFFYMH